MAGNLLVMQAGQMYLIDLTKEKAQSIKELFTKVNDEQGIYIVNLDDLEVKDLTDILMSGINRVSQPRIVPTGSTRRSNPSVNSDETSKIRAWAQSENITNDDGKPLADRGRIPQSIRDKYYASHSE